MPYYCQEHNVAWVLPDPTGWQQFTAHWNLDKTGVHKGHPRPSQDEVRVDEVPEGATVVSTTAKKPTKTSRAEVKEEQETEEPKEPAEETVDEDPQRLKRLLFGMGYTDQQQRRILLPFMTYESIRNNPMNLYNLIASNSDPRQKPFVPLIVSEYSGTAQEVEESPFFFPQPHQGPAPVFYPSFRQQPGQYNPFIPPFPSYMPSAPRTERSKDDPLVKALLEEVSTMKEELKEEREERERERQEREEERKQQALEERFANIDTHFSSLAEQMGELVKALEEKDREKVVTAATAQKDELSLKVQGLTEELQKERDNKMLTALTTLEKNYNNVVSEFTNLRKEILAGGGGTGRTVEDLAAQFAPELLNRIESAGTTLATEMAELRKMIGAGQGPIPRLPGTQGPGALKQAENIARQMALENSLISRGAR